MNTPWLPVLIECAGERAPAPHVHHDVARSYTMVTSGVREKVQRGSPGGGRGPTKAHDSPLLDPMMPFWRPPTAIHIDMDGRERR